MIAHIQIYNNACKKKDILKNSNTHFLNDYYMKKNKSSVNTLWAQESCLGLSGMSDAEPTKHFLIKRVITWNNVGAKVFIPWIVLSRKNLKWHFVLKQKRTIPYKNVLYSDNKQKLRLIIELYEIIFAKMNILS